MKPVSRLLAGAAVLVLLITGISAYLRLSQYGFGCADWPACYGANVAETSLSESSPLFWARVAHRVAATAAGLVFVAVALFWWSAWRNGRDRLASFAPLVLAAFLAWLGRYTPSSVPAVTIGNLLGGMATLGVLWWLRAVAELQRGGGEQSPAPALAKTAAIGLALLFAQIALGGLMSARLAAAACPSLPACGAWSGAFDAAGLNPFADIGRQELGEHTRQVLHMMHRSLGLAVALYLGWIGARAVRMGGRLRRFGGRLVGLASIQVALGASMVLLKMPLALAVAHNAIAALLVIALVSLLAETAWQPSAQVRTVANAG